LDEMMTAFRAYLGEELGDVAVRLLDRRLNGVSLRQLPRDPAFSGMTAWALRRLMASVRQACGKRPWSSPGGMATTSSCTPSNG
jgi:hypothetical protein